MERAQWARDGVVLQTRPGFQSDLVFVCHDALDWDRGRDAIGCPTRAISPVTDPRHFVVEPYFSGDELAVDVYFAAVILGIFLHPFKNTADVRDVVSYTHFFQGTAPDWAKTEAKTAAGECTGFILATRPLGFDEHSDIDFATFRRDLLSRDLEVLRLQPLRSEGISFFAAAFVRGPAHGIDDWTSTSAGTFLDAEFPDAGRVGRLAPAVDAQTPTW